jgi:hypothetical protein
MSKRKSKKAAAAIPTTALATAPVEIQTPAAAPEAATSKKASRSHRPAGLGFPNAKKLVNPQHTLEAKKEAAKKLGGTMLWVNKNWKVNVPAGEFSFPSRGMAALSVATFLETVSHKPAAPAPVEPVPSDEDSPSDVDAFIDRVEENEVA